MSFEDHVEKSLDAIFKSTNQPVNQSPNQLIP